MHVLCSRGQRRRTGESRVCVCLCVSSVYTWLVDRVSLVIMMVEHASSSVSLIQIDTIPIYLIFFSVSYVPDLDGMSSFCLRVSVLDCGRGCGRLHQCSPHDRSFHVEEQVADGSVRFSLSVSTQDRHMCLYVLNKLARLS